jgi:DNA-binding transcriptional MerR regulator
MCHETLGHPPGFEMPRIADTGSWLSLAAIYEALASLPPDRVPGVGDWRRLSESWRDELDERIARLERLRDRRWMHRLLLSLAPALLPEKSG